MVSCYACFSKTVLFSSKFYYKVEALSDYTGHLPLPLCWFKPKSYFIWIIASLLTGHPSASAPLPL